MKYVIIAILSVLSFSAMGQIEPYQIVNDVDGEHRILMTDANGEYIRVGLLDAVIDSIGIQIEQVGDSICIVGGNCVYNPTGGKFVDGTDTDDAVYMDGKVGIGTNAPNHKLEVYEETDLGSNVGDKNDMFSLKSKTSNSDFLNFTTRRVLAGSNWETAKHRIQRQVNSSLMGYMQFGSALGGYNDMITFGNENTESMRITPDGRVGIGTANPENILHTKKADPIVLIQDSETSLSTIESYIKFSGSQGSAAGGIFRTDVEQSIGYRDNSLVFDRAGVENMRIDSDGKVGIGTNNPSAEFDLVGDAEINGSLTVTDRVGTATKSAFFDANGVLIEGDIVSGGGKFVDGADADDAVYSGGNVGIMTSVPQATLDVSGTLYVDDDAEFSGILKVGGRTGGAAVKSAFFDSNDQLIEGDLVSGIDSSLSKVDQNIIAADTRVVDVDGKLIMRAGETSSAGVVVSASSTISGNKYSALTTNASSTTADGFYALETEGVRIRVGDEDEGRILYSNSSSGDAVWGQADNVGRITTTLSLWSDERQVLLAGTAYVSYPAISFPPSGWTTSQQHDGDVLTLINRSGGTRQLTGDIEGTTSTTVDVLDDDTIRLVYYSSGDYWIVLSNN